MTVVTIHQAKTNLSKLIAAAERGEEIIIARRDKPAVRLTPVEAPEPVRQRRVPGRLKGLIALDDSFFDPLPEEDLRLWEGRGEDER